MNEVYDNLVCLVTCDPSAGVGIPVNGTNFTSGIVVARSDGDADGDGINNTIDPDNAFSNAFSDIGLGGVTSGTIVDRAGWTATVSDISPKGVQFAVSGADRAGDPRRVRDGRRRAGAPRWGRGEGVRHKPDERGGKVTAIAAFPVIQLQKTAGPYGP